MQKKGLLKYGAIGLLIGAAIFVIREIYCAVMYIYNVSMRRGDKTFLTRLIDVSKEADVVCDDIEEEGDDLAQWVAEKRTTEIYIKGYKNTRLYGEIFNNDKSNKWVIIVHGYGGECSLMYYAGKVFYDRGYNVLIPDLRGHGNSAGEYIGMGWHDRLDIIRWCNRIVKLDKNADIILYGVSMGGAAVVMASGERLCKNVKCIIEDCGYTSVKEIMRCQLKKLRIPSFPLLQLTAVVCMIKNKYNPLEASAIKQIKKSRLPMLFLHGERDGFVPYEMMERLYNAKKMGYKEKHGFDRAGHGVSAMVEKESYWEIVFSFIDRVYKK